MESVSRAYPDQRLSGVDAPTTARPTYLAYVTTPGSFATVLIDPVSAEVLGELPDQSWIRSLQDLHYDLLGRADRAHDQRRRRRGHPRDGRDRRRDLVARTKDLATGVHGGSLQPRSSLIVGSASRHRHLEPDPHPDVGDHRALLCISVPGAIA